MSRAMHALVASFAAAVLLATSAGEATAQSGYQLSLAPGTPVRITTTAAPRTHIRGEALAIRGDTLFLGAPASGRRLGAYPLAELRSLEIRGGLDRRRGMLFGAIGGAALGALMGSEERGSVMAGMAMIGTLVGFAAAPAGWQRIPLPTR